MKVTEPLFYIGDMNREVVLTDYGINLISDVNSALEKDSGKSEYYTILDKYLNIKRV